MKKSKLLLISGIIGTLYLVYLIVYFAGGITSASDGAEVVGAGLATAIVMPHLICVGIAVIFNWLGWAIKARWAALVAGIMYAVSILCMFVYFMFVIVEMILCFVAFSKMKKE